MQECGEDFAAQAVSNVARSHSCHEEEGGTKLAKEAKKGGMNRGQEKYAWLSGELSFIGLFGWLDTYRALNVQLCSQT